MSPVFFEVFGHVGNALDTAAMAARNMLFLRLLALAGGAARIVYATYINNSVDLWWDIPYLGINLVNLGLLIYELKFLKFSLDEEALYYSVFASFSRKEFKKLLSVARWVNFSPGSVVIRQGEKVEMVGLIFKGLAEVIIDSSTVAMLKDGAFMGEMSLISGRPASATVVVTEESRILFWKQEDLRMLMDRETSVAQAMQNVFSKDLVEKLGKK